MSAEEREYGGGEAPRPAKRSYTKRARARKEAHTRARILDATLELWSETGPADATITAVATRAGVQRLTVYRHFPDETALARAARQRMDERYPLPDPAEWASMAQPARRLRRALRALYTHYQDAAPLLVALHRDAPRVPALQAWAADRAHYLEGVFATLDGDWTPRPKRARMVAAALALAIRFETWQSFAGSGLKPGRAARLMERMIRGLVD